MLDINKDTKETDPPKITAWQAAYTLFQTFSKIGLTNVLIIGMGLTIAVQNGLIKIPYGPQPNVVPNVVPNTKLLRDQVPIEAAVELGDFWHAIAMLVANDTYMGKNDKGEPVEMHVINTVGDFDLLVKRSANGFNSIHNISGISSINEPIKIKLQRATGTLRDDANIDDPATKVRQSIVSICKDISEEFNPDMKLVSLNKVR